MLEPRLTPVTVAVELPAGATRAIPSDLEAVLAGDQALRLILVVPSLQPFGDPAALDREPNPRVAFIDARSVSSAEDPVRAVRGDRLGSTRVLMRLLRDEAADAAVASAPADVVLAAATFTLPLLAGATRPFLAQPLGSSGPLLVDAGADVEATADLLVQYALLGAAAAAALLCAGPGALRRVGLLAAVGASGQRSSAHALADELLAQLGREGLLDYRGRISGAALSSADPGVDVAVTDGASGALLASALRGAGQPGQPRVCLLGLAGTVLLADAPAGPRDLGAAVRQAASAVRAGLTPACAAAADLARSRRRRAAGLVAVTP